MRILLYKYSKVTVSSNSTRVVKSKLCRIARRPECQIYNFHTEILFNFMFV